jgi:hypothetical protein
MCPRSAGDMLNQNSRAWLKWSSKDTAASRTLRAAGTSTGTSMYAPVSAPARNGQPPSRELGRYGATPRCTAVWCMPSRSMSFTGACVRLIGICPKSGPPSLLIRVSR